MIWEGKLFEEKEVSVYYKVINDTMVLLTAKARYGKFTTEGGEDETGYDPVRDLLYIYFAEPFGKAAKTVTVVPGVHADFSAKGKLIGIEVLDASEVMGRKIEFALPEDP